jgi:hypothetical protein
MNGHTGRLKFSVDVNGGWVHGSVWPTDDLGRQQIHDYECVLSGANTGHDKPKTVSIHA